MEILNQTMGRKRTLLDKFYTNSITVDICISRVKELLFNNKSTTDLIIEPSAGNGSFIKAIKELTPNFRFYDIHPENNEIIPQDFLELDLNSFANENIHIVGNPPFGRQSSLAIKFIKRCCEAKVKSISFILPLSFKKETQMKYFGLNYHLVEEFDIHPNSFLMNNINCDVKCIFQIWKYEPEQRVLPVKLIPDKFIFVKKTENPDISFRRVGINAGAISKDVSSKNENSHYFIKFNTGEPVEIFIDKLKSLKFDHNNTVGPRSISKQELLRLFN